MGRYIGVDLDKIYADQKFPLGGKTEADPLGRVYRFGRYYAGTDTVEGVAGQLGIGLDSAYPEGSATMDYSGAGLPQLANKPYGFLQAAFTDLTYGWYQIEGPNRLPMLTDNGVAQGDNLMKHATTDGAVDTHTGDPKITGTANEADTGTALAAGEATISIL